MTRYIDLAYSLGADGVYDLVANADTGDLAVTEGLETAILVSAFSDRRAYDSEVSDTMDRRGWIGDLVSGVPGDLHGSGLWLYEQRRLTVDTAIGVRDEAVQSLDWMADEGLASHAEAEVIANPGNRQLTLIVTVHLPNGGRSERAFLLADATRTGIIAKLQ